MHLAKVELEQILSIYQAMDAPTTERQKLIETIKTLPDEALIELSNFIDYLRYKSTKSEEAENSGSTFLLSIAGLVASTENDISERDEEILQSEVDPVCGWNLKTDKPT